MTKLEFLYEWTDNFNQTKNFVKEFYILQNRKLSKISCMFVFAKKIKELFTPTWKGTTAIVRCVFFLR